MKKLLLATAFAAALVAPAKAAPLTTTNCDATGDQGSINAAVAIPSCQEAIRQNPTRSEFVLALGRAYFVAGNFPAAAEQYKRAADMGDMTAQANLGTRLLRRWKFFLQLLSNTKEPLIWEI